MTGFFIIGFNIFPSSPEKCADGLLWSFDESRKISLDTRIIPEHYFPAASCTRVALKAADNLSREGDAQRACLVYRSLANIPCETLILDSIPDRQNCRATKKESKSKLRSLQEKAPGMCTLHGFVKYSYQQKYYLSDSYSGLGWVFDRPLEVYRENMNENVERWHIGSTNWYLEVHTRLRGVSLKEYQDVWLNRLKAYPGFDAKLPWQKFKHYRQMTNGKSTYRVFLFEGDQLLGKTVGLLQVSPAREISSVRLFLRGIQNFD
ncbi:MAG: hypothetical protein KDK38_13860 [Leptospiraceae bacterium]|nr:hypothetical protein [Leptospiraceae bacterium]